MIGEAPANNERPDICRLCSPDARCCSVYPGIWAPEQFIVTGSDPDPQMIADEIAEGRAAIDWWEEDGCDETMLFVRPSTKGNEGVVRDPSWGDECVFLGPQGCQLQFGDRPRQCQVMEVTENGPCRQAAGNHKIDYARAWHEYKGILKVAECIALRMMREKPTFQRLEHEEKTT